jgi:IS30 family transposase
MDQGWRPLGLAERRAVREALAAGLSKAEAAVRVGVSIRSVYRVVAEAGGMPPRWKDRSPLRLSLAEREEISRGLQRGESLRCIAARLGRAPSTISREVANNDGVEGYRAWRADRSACERARRPKPAKLATRPRLRAVVETWLADRWSPRQIADRLVVEFPDDLEMRVSHETIYQSLFVQGRGALRKELAVCLRSGRTQRRPQSRAARNGGRGRIIDMVMIADRPAEADDRAVPGHWEGDLLIGKDGHSAIATLVERSTRFVMLLALPEGRSAPAVRDALTRGVRRLPFELWRSLTWDQGKEMAGHARFTIETGIAVYFCDPHSPWQRGTNENTNGLLRQYFPKGTSLRHYSQQDLDTVAAQLNGRPRQTLGWMKPCEKLAELVAITT